MLDIKKLLESVSVDNPSGIDMSGEADYYILREMTRGKEETQFSKAESPEWKKVFDLAVKLFGKGKDLWIVYSMFCAAVKLKADTGLVSSLELLDQLLELYWDTLYPELDHEDDEPAFARFNIINDLLLKQGPFINGVSSIKLSKSRIGSFTYRDIQLGKGEIKPIAGEKVEPLDVITASVSDTDEEIITRLKENFAKAIELVDKIKQFLKAKDMTSNCETGINSFIEMLNNILKFLNTEVIDEDLQVSDVDETSSEQENVDSVEGKNKKTVISAKSSSGEINGCSDIIRLLEKICQWYEDNEPSSPVPLFLKRAEALVGKSFFEIVQDVALSGVNEVVDLFKISISESNESSPETGTSVPSALPAGKMNPPMSPPMSGGGMPPSMPGGGGMGMPPPMPGGGGMGMPPPMSMGGGGMSPGNDWAMPGY